MILWLLRILQAPANSRSDFETEMVRDVHSMTWRGGQILTHYVIYRAASERARSTKACWKHFPGPTPPRCVLPRSYPPRLISACDLDKLKTK